MHTGEDEHKNERTRESEREKGRDEERRRGGKEEKHARETTHTMQANTTNMQGKHECHGETCRG